MLVAIRNLVVNILASFIRDREARHAFRNKYKKKTKFRKLRDDNNILKARISKLQNSLNSVGGRRLFGYSNATIASCKNFYGSIDTSELTEKYQNLIRGLDDESIACVSQILARIKLISQQKLPPGKSARGG